MDGSYFTPMYGGLMLPIIKRQGSDIFQLGSSMYVPNVDTSETPTPLSASAMSVSSSMSQIDANKQPSFHMPRDYRYRTPRGPQIVPNYHVKRQVSIGGASTGDESTPSAMLATHDEEDVLTGDFSPTKHLRLLEPVPENDGRVRLMNGGRKSTTPAPLSHKVLSDTQVFRLGDEGRSKLKSALSEKVRRDPDIRRRIEAIGKIRLASMQQLMQMAKEAGLWEYAATLAEEHEKAKNKKMITNF